MSVFLAFSMGHYEKALTGSKFVVPTTKQTPNLATASALPNYSKRKEMELNINSNDRHFNAHYLTFTIPASSPDVTGTICGSEE